MRCLGKPEDTTRDKAIRRRVDFNNRNDAYRSYCVDLGKIKSIVKFILCNDSSPAVGCYRSHPREMDHANEQSK